MEQVRETKEDKEVKSIGKILTSAADDGDALTILTRAVSYTCKQTDMTSLANRLAQAYPDVAFLLTYQDDKSLQLALAISPNHVLMGKSRDKIYADIEKELQESPVFYPPGTTWINETMTTETDGYSYYSRDILANEYVGKIVDAANSTIFTYLKANKYLPAEKEDEDPYLDFDNL